MPKRQKLSKAEKLNRDIARWELRQEGAVNMLRKSAEELVRLRRQRRRMLAKETTAQVTKQIEAIPDVGAPAIEAVKNFVTLGQAAQQAVNKIAAEMQPPPKPKRRRHTKAVQDILDRDTRGTDAPAARRDRMKALGFRPTPRRGK